PPSPADLGTAEVIDLAGSLHRMGGDMELFQEFVGMYDADSPELTESIRAAVRGKDPAALHRAAHRLKGLVSNFGARRVAEAAFVLEKIGQAGELGRSEEALRTLDSELARLNEALAPFRGRQSGK